MIPVFEAGDTQQFTWTSCVAPDAAPNLGITEPFSLTIIHSALSISSSATDFYAFFTMPVSVGIYLFEWRAIKTVAGSAYNFIDKGCFRVDESRITHT